MAEDLERFLRNAHLAARLVEGVLERGYLERAAGGRVTFDQLNVLKFIARPARVRVKDVARFLNASGAAASKAVARLERKGLARTATDAADRRSGLVALTAGGRAVVRRYERYKQDRLRALLKGGSADRLARSLEEVVELLLRDRAAAGNPCLGCGAYYTKECIVRAHGQPCSCPL
jgi:DNA-binding MarR family transcriptional regulator